MLSDEQMRKIWPFSLLNDEQMSNKVGVKHQPEKDGANSFASDLGLFGGTLSDIWHALL